MRPLFFFLFLVISTGLFAQGTETFSNMTTGSSSYSTVTWTGDNGLTWTATRARTDQTITGPAIAVDGRTSVEKIECAGIAGGIGNLSFKHLQVFSGSGGTVTVKINGNTVQSSIVATTNIATATLNNVNISGTFTLTLEIATQRIGIDDISWTGYTGGGGGGEPDPEPTNHVTSFSGPSPTATAITLSWTDATGTTLPDAYLIRGTTLGFASIATPSDGTPVSTSGLASNVSYGVQSVTFTGLNASTTYYFKIFPYTNSGAEIDYKTDGTIPQVSVTTTTSGGGDIPDGYYDTATGSGATLKTNLYNIIKGHTSVSYNSLYTHFESTDSRANGKVWDMYSDVVWNHGQATCGNYSGEGDCYNREHSFPASWFNDATPMYSDLFHLYPTDGYVNNRRSNYPFGRVNNPTYTSQNGSKVGNNSTQGYSGEAFEPIDEYKGDFARTVFYMVTRYENLISGWENNNSSVDAVLSGNTFPALEQWALDLYYQWHLDDPVSEKETDRNNAVYEIQNNRNPYIDHPEYVFQIWGGVATPVELTEWKGHWLNGKVLLTWTTESEWESAGFEVSRSTNPQTGFETIAKITPEEKLQAMGTSGGKYQIQDQVPAGNRSWFYRLSEIATNGERTNYPVIRVETLEAPAPSLAITSIYPNPFNPETTIRLESPTAETASLRLINSLGQVVREFPIRLSPGTNAIPLNISGGSQPLPSGMYFLSVQGKSGLSVKPVVLLK